MRIQPDIAPLPNIAAVKVEDPKEGTLLSPSPFSYYLCFSFDIIFPVQPKLVEYLRVARYE